MRRPRITITVGEETIQATPFGFYQPHDQKNRSEWFNRVWKVVVFDETNQKMRYLFLDQITEWG